MYTGACYRCGKADHRATHCPFKTASCHNCGKVGHIKRACRLRQRQKPNPTPVHTVQKEQGHAEEEYALLTPAKGYRVHLLFRGLVHSSHRRLWVEQVCSCLASFAAASMLSAMSTAFDSDRSTSVSSRFCMASLSLAAPAPRTPLRAGAARLLRSLRASSR